MKTVASAIVILSGAVVVAGGTIGQGAAGEHNYGARDFGQGVAIGGIVLMAIALIVLVGQLLCVPPKPPE